MNIAGAGKGRTVATSRGAAKLQPLALALVAAGLLASCGGSSSGPNEGPAAKFLGRWERDAASMLTITCLMPDNTPDFSATYNPWSEFEFERGVLSDATETSTVCTRPTGLALDVNGSKLSVTLPNDPYTGKAPRCLIQVATDLNMNPVYLDLTFTAFDFTLLAAVKDKAPTAMLSLTASGPVVQDDGTGTNTYVIVDNCTYSGTNENYHRMSQP